MAAAASQARSWNPAFAHSDRERWICIYPAYINSKKKLSEGRQIPISKAVDDPSPMEIKDVLISTGLVLGVENKVYPREVDKQKCRGRIRVQLKNDDGTPILPQFPTRRSLLLYIGETIPKLKTRAQSSSSQQQAESVSAGGGGRKNKNKKK